MYKKISCEIYAETSSKEDIIMDTASWYVGNGIYFRDALADGTPFVNAVFARTPFNSGGSYRADYYAYANAGTVFTIYKIGGLTS